LGKVGGRGVGRCICAASGGGHLRRAVRDRRLLL